ncbi:Smr/MutS family protein [Uliginosibacterium sp. H1]|uniref:Smr/MutS family protein n=1 Tax=Uliginosibacterium sp. H1 TaxID=3114757 RepID=UPI002E17FDD5|nr:Smr/MutS family protein [Uliginosibacterium sp. H1]
MAREKASLEALRALQPQLRKAGVARPTSKDVRDGAGPQPSTSMEPANWQAGATPLPSDNRVELRPPPPPPVPRPRTADPEASASDDTGAVPAVDNSLDLPSHWFAADRDLPTTPEQQALRQALAGVRPIHHDRVELDLPKPRPHPRQSELDEREALAESIYAPTPLELRLEGGDELAYLREGMGRQTLRDLRRGRWVIQDAVDLHGCNRDEARELLAAFMGHCRKQNTRCVRIIHGKGLGSPGKEPVLKGLVAGWLMNYDDVLAYCQARVHDGGAGALIVLLRHHPN